MVLLNPISLVRRFDFFFNFKNQWKLELFILNKQKYKL